MYLLFKYLGGSYLNRHIIRSLIQDKIVCIVLLKKIQPWVLVYKIINKKRGIRRNMEINNVTHSEFSKQWSVLDKVDTKALAAPMGYLNMYNHYLIPQKTCPIDFTCSSNSQFLCPIKYTLHNIYKVQDWASLLVTRLKLAT